jgi:hypothetical protein
MSFAHRGVRYRPLTVHKMCCDGASANASVSISFSIALKHCGQRLGLSSRLNVKNLVPRDPHRPQGVGSLVSRLYILGSNPPLHADAGRGVIVFRSRHRCQ